MQPHTNSNRHDCVEEAGFQRNVNAVFEPTIQTVGLDGFLISFGTKLGEAANRASLAFREAVEKAGWPEVCGTSTSLVSTYIRFDPLQYDHATIRHKIEELLLTQDWLRSELPQGRNFWTIPTVYGGHALVEAAAVAGLCADEAIAMISSTRVRVQTIGFAPGMPYLGELPSVWDIPRCTSLNDAIPAGALCVAIRQLVLFPVATPTGWRQIGQTAIRLFNPHGEPPFLLRPGDEVIFESVESLRDFEDDPQGGAHCVPIS